MKKILFILTCVWFLNLQAQEKKIPGFINFQGILKSEAGTPVDGEYKLIFRIYDSQIEGNLLWEETHDSVLIKNGYFNVVLGSLTPFPQGFFDNNRNLWVGIQVGDDGQEFPRKKLLSVAFAFQAEKSDAASKAFSLDCEGCITEGHLAQSITDTLASAATKDEVTNLKNNLEDEITSAKEELSGEIDSLANDYYQFKDSTQSSLSDIQSGISDLNESVQSLNSDYNDFKESTNSQFESVNNKINELNTNYDNISSSVEGINSDLSSLTSKVNSIDSALNSHIENKDIHKTSAEIFSDIIENYDGEGSGLDADTVDGMQAQDLKVEEHLIRNGSFESGFDFWIHEPGEEDGGPKVVNGADGYPFHIGTKSVMFKNQKDTPFDNSKVVIYKEFIPVIAGEKIHFSMWYFGESDLYNEQPSTFMVKLLTYNKNFELIDELTMGSPSLYKNGSGKWTEFLYDYQVPETGEVLFIRFKIEAVYDPDRNYAFYVDDIDATSGNKSFVRLNSYAASDKPGGPAIDLKCESCVNSLEIENETILDEDISVDANISPQKIKGVAATLTGSQNFANGTLFIDAQNHRVGINTTSPLTTLHVNGDMLLSHQAVIKSINSKGEVENWMWPRWSDDKMYTNYGKNGWVIRNNDSKTTMFMSSSNKVGIGTDSPSYKLHVTGDVYADGGWVRISGDKGIYFESHGGGWYMNDNTWIKSYGNKNVYINKTLAVSGNIGIGTTNPAHKLTVSSGWIEPAAGYGLNWRDNAWGGGGDDAWIKYYSEGGENTKLQIGINNDANDDLELYQQGAWRVKLENGNIYLNGRFYLSGSENGYKTSYASNKSYTKYSWYRIGNIYVMSGLYYCSGKHTGTITFPKTFGARPSVVATHVRLGGSPDDNFVTIFNLNTNSFSWEMYDYNDNITETCESGEFISWQAIGIAP